MSLRLVIQICKRLSWYYSLMQMYSFYRGCMYFFNYLLVKDKDLD